MTASTGPRPTMDMERTIPLTDQGISVKEVPLVSATAENLKGYATIEQSFEDAKVEIVTWPQQGWRPVISGTGNEGGITSGGFEMRWAGNMMYAQNHAVGGDYVTGWFDDPGKASENASNVDRSRILVREANYHPDGGQVFFPRHQSPFVALLALPGDDVTADDFVAFYCNGRFGINLHPGVWHQPVFPLQDKVVFDDKQGRVHACIGVDFVTEFGVYLSVPLKAPDPA
jgi:ureidoglycolate lyase